MMRELGKFGVWLGASQIDVELAATIESLGFGAIWLGGSPPGDLQIVDEVISATQSITVATGIVNMWKDDAETVAVSYGRIERDYPGRFLLGVGVGHRERIAEYQSPYRKMVGYLDALDRSGVPQDSMILAALGPKSLRLAAERTVGTHPYFTSPRHTRAARELLGAGPVIAPEQTVVLDSDAESARATAREFMARYLGTKNYTNNLRREGWAESDMADGGSDRLVDEIVLHGDESAIVTGLHRHLEAGADHVGIQVLGGDRAESYARLAKALGLSTKP